MGIHERAKKVLVDADFVSSTFVRYIDRIDTGIGSGPIYLYVVLVSNAFPSAWKLGNCGASDSVGDVHLVNNDEGRMRAPSAPIPYSHDSKTGLTKTRRS